MEEEGIGSVIYYIVIAVVTILSIVAGRKKKQAQQQPAPAESFPEIPDNPEDFFPRKKEEESLADLIKSIKNNEAKLEETKMTSYENYDETKTDHKAVKKTKPIVISEENEPAAPELEFDPVKAVIYSEIFNRKY